MEKLKLTSEDLEKAPAESGKKSILNDEFLGMMLNAYPKNKSVTEVAAKILLIDVTYSTGLRFRFNESFTIGNFAEGIVAIPDLDSLIEGGNPEAVDKILEIPKDSDELYYRIEIVFRALDKRLAPTGSIKTFAETSYRLLCEMENVSDLFIRSYDEYLTLNFLRKNFKNSVVMGDEEGIRAMIAQKIKIEFYPDRVILYKDGREVVVAERIFYRNNINAFFKKITEI